MNTNIFNAVVGIVESVKQSEITDALNSLSDNDFRVIALRVGVNGARPMSLSQVSLETGVSRQRCDQIEKHAIGKLREHFSGKGFNLADSKDIRVTKHMICVVGADGTKQTIE